MKETKRKRGLTEDMFKLADHSLHSSLIEILLFMFYAASSSIIFFDYFLIVINFPDDTFFNLCLLFSAGLCPCIEFNLYITRIASIRQKNEEDLKRSNDHPFDLIHLPIA